MAKLTAYIKRKENQANSEAAEVDRECSDGGCKYVGAHLSIQNGIDLVVNEVERIGGKAAAMFLKNQRTFKSTPYTPATIKAFRESSSDIKEYYLPHASYLINLAQPDPEKGERAYQMFVDDMKRCEQLGIPNLNFHPGSNVGGLPVAEACQLISSRINRALQETTGVCAVIENMAGQGKVLGVTFQEIAMMIEGVTDKSRVGVCLDTCHLFGAGYDIRTSTSFAKIMKEFDTVVGLSYLKGVHLNDSKQPLGSRRDRHESLGKGLIGLEAFSFIMNSSMFSDIPLILETPDPSIYAKEIALLYDLIKKKDADQSNTTISQVQ
ncbi:deoxyribonuclease IV [Nematocida homosporus]|uniref:deoxyribonuclease IV n=1 Tax=Nematocida homosporus TaxID=1912981 RepID=UPI002220B31E|nr:deoxyribonuclease IV [Nematocida homosporus]KAI5185099.1 deoxyribonuclease IV [Nematocida homosporus]